MLEIRRRLDLLHEPLGAQHGGELRAEDLDGDLAVALQVLGHIHRRHPTLAELSHDPVLIGEGGTKPGDRVAHRLVPAFIGPLCEICGRGSDRRGRRR
jgi:hypothetical protein